MGATKLYISMFLLLGLTAGVVSAASINGLTTNARVFNDFSTTALTIVNGNSVNLGAFSSASIDESGYVNDGVGANFANRHDIVLSSDGGVTNHVFGIDDTFTVSARVTLTAGSNSPRKEAGFRINSPVTGDMQFIVNTDFGEIVAFGGGAPFHSFGSNGGGNGYTPGTTILMGFTETGGGDGVGGVPDTIEFFIDRGLGLETSGPHPWVDLEGGPTNYNVAMYVQSAPNLANPEDFVSANFNNITFSPSGAAVPLPSAVWGGVALLGCLELWRKLRLKIRSRTETGTQLVEN